MTKVLLGNGFDMSLSELYKIMVNEVIFVGFRGVIALNAPHWFCSCMYH